jgi:hypothetical protein
VIDVSEPQVWTVLALFSSFLGVMSAVFFAMLRSSTNAITVEIRRLDANIEEGDHRTRELMEARFSDVDHRLTNVEDDLRIVKAHLIGQQSV